MIMTENINLEGSGGSNIYGQVHNNKLNLSR